MEMGIDNPLCVHYLFCCVDEAGCESLRLTDDLDLRSCLNTLSILGAGFPVLVGVPEVNMSDMVNRSKIGYIVGRNW